MAETTQYSGTLIADLQALTAKYSRSSSVDEKQGWKILVEARLHLCDRVMEAGDVQAWWILAELQDELIYQPSPTCLAEMARPGNCVAAICGQPSREGYDFCPSHVEEFGL